MGSSRATPTSLRSTFASASPSRADTSWAKSARPGARPVRTFTTRHGSKASRSIRRNSCARESGSTARCEAACSSQERSRRTNSAAERPISSGLCSWRPSATLLHVLHLFWPGAERLLRQRRLHERVEVAVEHRAGVGGLHAGAQILDHLVGLQHVGPDLVAPADVGLGGLLGGGLLLTPLQFALVEPRA